MEFVNIQEKPTLFGALKHAYDNVCEKVATSVVTNKRKFTCKIANVTDAIKEYIEIKVINETERKGALDIINDAYVKYITTLDLATSYIGKLASETTNHVMDTTARVMSVTASAMDTVEGVSNDFNKKIHAPDDPDDLRVTLYKLEEHMTNIMQSIIDIPELTSVEMKKILALDVKFHDSKLTKIINFTLNYYYKNIKRDDEKPDLQITETHRLLFIAHACCVKLETKTTPSDKTAIFSNVDITTVKLSTIDYQNDILDKGVLTDDEIDAEYQKICEFAEEADVEDSNQKKDTGNNLTTRIINGISYNYPRYSAPLNAEEYATLKAKKEKAEKAKMAEKAHAEDLNNGTDVDSDEDERVTKSRRVGDNTTGGKRKSKKRRITKKKKHIKRKATKKKKYSKSKTKRKVHKKK